MTHPNPTYATLDDWIAREALPFSLDKPATFHAAAAIEERVGTIMPIDPREP